MTSSYIRIKKQISFHLLTIHLINYINFCLSSRFRSNKMRVLQQLLCASHSADNWCEDLTTSVHLYRAELINLKAT